MTVGVLVSLTIVLLLFKEPAKAALIQWTENGMCDTTSRAASSWALCLPVLVGLIVVLNPEVRLVLLLVDAIGVEILLMLLLFQGKEILRWVGTVRVPPMRWISMARMSAMRYLETRGSYPVPLPCGTSVKQYPLWSIYAIFQPIALGTLLSVPLCVLIESLRDALT
jgi:hypothetical protein